jgi:hypothetical protein
MWSLLLIGANGILFDTALVRYFVAKIVDGAVEEELQQGGQLDPTSVLDSIVTATAAQTNVDVETIRALFDQPIDTMLFDLASDKSGAPENVLCRAFFLLRFATLSVSRNLAASPSEPCQKWIRAWLSNAGLLDASVADPADMESDYRDALDDFYPESDVDLPRALWTGAQAGVTTLLTRAEGFLGWALPV